jgi:sugar-specific transcriptional regulator TrmB
MDATLLEQIGLNPTQAKAYLALISSGSLTPPQLSDKIQITRTNAYEVLKQLTELKLAIKSGAGAKLTYRPENPANLENLMESHRNQVIEHETRLRSLMPQLMTYFYTYSEQPGVRFYQGKEGIIKVYEDMLRTRQTIYFLRSTADDKFMGLEFYNKFRLERAKLSIETIALTPDVPGVNRDPAVDEQNLFRRTWFDPNLYTAPVEWDIYGNKVAILSFGEEALATIIESPQIAEAMRQMFQLMQRGFGHPDRALQVAQKSDASADTAPSPVDTDEPHPSDADPHLDDTARPDSHPFQ